MTPDPDLESIARSIVEANRFMTLGTADADGRPWVSPVWFASEDPEEFVWASKPGARHSLNIAARPEIAIVIFDSHRPGTWQALYLSAVAEQLGADDLDAAIALYARRSEEQGLRLWTREDVEPPARHRLYRARVLEQFVLDEHDERLPLDFR